MAEKGHLKCTLRRFNSKTLFKDGDPVSLQLIFTAYSLNHTSTVSEMNDKPIR